MALSNIILKDTDGNDIVYDGVKNIQIINDSETLTTYTDMSNLNMYFASYNSTTKEYTIEGLWLAVKGAGYAICPTNGYDYCILSSKTLITGNSYDISELAIGGV